MTPDFDSNHLKGVDIFHGDNVASFHDLAANGVKFCIIKATQGLNVVDAKYQDNYNRAKSVGVLPGAYHFLSPTSDPKAQAERFLQVAAPKDGDIVPCLDSETAGDAIGEKSHEFAQVIKAELGRWPLLYTGQAFYTEFLQQFFPASDYPLWLARYGAMPSISCAFWQYTDVGRTGDQPPLDTDVFYGDLDALKTHCL